MSEQTPIKDADLARYWGCSPGNITNLHTRKGMPSFTSLRAADEWRSVNAPLRKRPQMPSSPAETSLKKGSEVDEKKSHSSISTTDATQTPATGATPTAAPPAPDGAAQIPLPGVDGGADAAGVDDSDKARGAKTAGGRLYAGLPKAAPEPERIDVAAFVDPAGDFLAIMLRQATEVPQIAYGLLRRTMERGEPGAIAAASKNWHEVSGHAASVLERFVDAKKEAGDLLTIDDVADVVVTELEEVRKKLKHLGRRVALKLAPDNPAPIQKVFDEAVDAALGDPLDIVERVKLDQAAAADEVAPELAAAPAPAAPAA